MVTQASDAWQLVPPRDHRSLDHQRVDEAGNVAAELGQPLGRGASGSSSSASATSSASSAGFMIRLGRLPHQNARALAAVVRRYWSHSRPWRL